MQVTSLQLVKDSKQFFVCVRQWHVKYFAVFAVKVWVKPHVHNRNVWIFFGCAKDGEYLVGALKVT